MRNKFCILLLILMTSASLFAAPKETPPPGQAKYIIILWEPGTPVPDDPDKKMKRVDEPDFVKAGGKVLHKKNNLRVVYLPYGVAKKLQKSEAVAYIQRVWTGESTDNWDESFTVPPGPRVQSDSDTNLEWGPKSYAYDGSGNIKQAGSDEFTYDSAGRLIRSVVSNKTETYKYDSFGNLTEKAVAGGTPVQISVDGGSNRVIGPEYDEAGNMTTTGRRAYTFDSLNMLTSTTTNLGTRRILYDANDERIGTLIDSSLSRWTIRDFEGQVVREYKGEDLGLSMLWIWEMDQVRGEGQLVGGETQEWWYTGTGIHHYGGQRHYHLDHLGSVRVVSNKDGRAVSENDFFPFGSNITKTFQEQINWGDPHVDGMRFAGHWRDYLGNLGAETDDYLDNMHARAYDPNMGRFLSVDPAMDSAIAERPQSWNRYAYVLNSPIGNTDPTGKVACTVSDPAVNGGQPFQSDCSTFTPEGDITEQEYQAALEAEAQAQVSNAGAMQNMGRYYASRVFEGLVPQGTLVIGVSGSAIFPIGLEGSMGIALNTDIDSESHFDVFGYGGAGVGLDLGVNGSAGWIPGEMSNVAGSSTNVTASIAIASTTIMYNDQGTRLGNVVGIGPSLTPISASGTRGKTWCVFGCR